MEFYNYLHLVYIYKKIDIPNYLSKSAFTDYLFKTTGSTV